MTTGTRPPASITALAGVTAVLMAYATSCASSAPAPQAPSSTASQPVYDAAPLIPREVLTGNPEKLDAKLSPDGTRLAYLAPDQDDVLNVWVRTLGEDDDKVITRDRVRGIRVYFWAPSSEHIIYLQDQGGDENWQVYAVPAGGGEARNLTPMDGISARIIAVEDERPGEILVGINDRDPRLHDVYRIDIATGERTLVQKNDINAVGWIADHTLTLRAAVVFRPDGGVTLMHRADARSPWQELHAWSAEDALTSQPLFFKGDNRHLYVLTSENANTVELRTIDVTTGEQATVAKDPTADVTRVTAHPKTHEVQAVALVRARREWQVLDPALEADFAALARLHDGDALIASRDRADSTWIVSFDQDQGPLHYYVYDRAGEQGSFLFSSQPELDNQPLAPMEPVSYQARDGLTIHGYLTTPVGVEAKDLPAVVFPHGGPWHRDTWGFDALAQLLANRGYAVLQPNFRGSTGYGKEFLNAGDREWGGKMQDDITDGTRWLIDQGIADPERVCIMGGSYGGYATLMGLAKEPDLYACGVDIVGVANLLTWMENIPPYWKPILPLLRRRVGDPETEAEFLKSRSPVFLADRIKAPLLVVQGANDPRVPRDESVQIRDVLQAAGHEVQYLEFADEGHGMARPENRLEFIAAAEKFLADKLGGRYQE